jgi:tRNA threonylcarbamoyladenosine modification (KEOPS) complex  Pcc1 subunit
MMKAKAVIRLRFPSERHLETVFRALEPETRKPATMRSKAHLEREDKFLFLKVEAEDTVALRAALNAYLRWINAVLGTLEILKMH